MYPRDKCVHQLFEEQAARTPDAVAVAFEDLTLSYGQLNSRANQLAHYLRTLGVKPDDLIGVCSERCSEMIIALLAVLKSGGAYVPLDPLLPQQRLAFLLNDTKCSFILTPRCRRDLWIGLQDESLHRPAVLVLEELSVLLSGTSKSNPTCTNTPKDLAYVMYTSGTTGRPKGVMVTHLGIVRLVVDASYVALTRDDILIQYAPLAFDASTFEVWGSLLNGARLVVLEPNTLDHAELGRAIIDHKVTTLWLTAAMFHEMLEHAPTALAGVRQLLAGGDVLLPDKVRSYLRLPKHGRLINGYGPTENTTFSCCGVYEYAEQIGASVSIGRPIAGTVIHILDDKGQPVPIGLPGEIYLGGDGLARGYLNLPELTAQSFVGNPFSTDSNERLYRSGDRGRWLPDGAVDFIGRVDHQVKIRGHRVELSEIESVLLQAEGVSESVVVAITKSEERPAKDTREKRLRAYVVVEGAHRNRSAAALRNFLKERLPDYMIPSGFVMLEEMPLTANGKVDRIALEQLAAEELVVTTDYVSPQNEVERLLVEIWQELLELERIGLEDNFFDLGGHSLLAMQAITRIRVALDTDISLRVLFENPTIVSLAAKLAQSAGGRGAANIQQAFPAEECKPLSFAQERLWFLDNLEGSNAAYQIRQVMRLQGEVNTEALQTAINTIVARHESLRTKFVEVDGKPRRVIIPERTVVLEFSELTGLEAVSKQQTVAALLREETNQPFDLSSGTLMRGSLLKLEEQEYILSLTFHHIIFDGWSRAVFNRELSELYEVLCANLPSPLTPVAMQYGDYVLWQRQKLEASRLKDHLTYWIRRLGDVPTLNLATDYTRPAKVAYEGGKHSFCLSSALSSSLKNFNRGRNVTPFMTLLAAYQVLLSRYSGQKDIVVGTPIGNRPMIELENLIGFFVNMLALRVDLSGNPDFHSLVSQVRDVALGAFEHQDLPFEELVKQLNPPRSLSQHPIFQVTFSVVNTPVRPLTLPGLQVTPIDTPASQTPFDLELELVEEGEIWKGTFFYRSDLFDSQTIERIAVHYQTLLAELIADPKCRVDEIPIIDAAESRQLLVEWNSTKESCPNDTCVGELFEEQVERSPERIAVEFEGQSRSYHWLNTRANQLAHYLRRLEVGPEDLVAVRLEPSIEMLVALLGIIKSGGAYLPLDPGYPAEGIQHMLKNARPRLMITDSRLTALPALPEGTQLVCLDQSWGRIRLEAECNPLHKVTGDNLFNVIYTSGSTGAPKGALITNRSVVNLLYAMQRLLQLSDADIMLAVTAISFDIAALELFLPLLSGARVALLSKHEAQDGLELSRRISRSGATIMQSTPATWRMLLESGWQGNGSLRALSGGEVLSEDLARRLQPEVREIWNLYGPTETTIWSTAYKLDSSYSGNFSVPIGRPIANTFLYILDPRGQPAPVGLPGEIYIGGGGACPRLPELAGADSAKFCCRSFQL